MKNLGDGAFEFGDQEAFPDSARLVHPRHQEVIDFNGDGFDDYVAVSHGYDVEPQLGERNLLLISQPEGSLADVSLDNELFDYDGFTHALDIGDINGDGITDIVTGDLFVRDENVTSGSNIRLLINDGAGQFSRVPFNPLHPNAGALSLKLVDLDGDGYDELVAGGMRSEDPTMFEYVFWNDASGVPGAGGHTVLPEYFDDEAARYGDTLDIEAMDLDFDGDNDLVVIKTNNYVGKTLRFIINEGNRTFSEATDQYTALTELDWDQREGIPAFLNAVDVNNDGLQDLFIEYGGPIFEQHSHIWLRNPDGSFTEFPTSNLPLLEYDYGNGFVLGYNFWSWLFDRDLDGDLDIMTRYQDYGLGNISESGQPAIRWRILDGQVSPDPGMIFYNGFENALH